MFFIHDDSSAASDAVMRAMFEARKRVFVDLLGWDLAVLADRYEIDQFDDENARYLIITDPHHSHLASARLLPTTRPHILDTLFACCATRRRRPAPPSLKSPASASTATCALPSAGTGAMR